MPLTELDPPSTLPRTCGICRPSAEACGVVVKPQSNRFLICGTECMTATRPGVRTILDRSAPPASSSTTLAPDAASRPATMQPDEPAPTTT
jgi:hypothetical protein